MEPPMDTYIFNLHGEEQFRELAMKIFKYQSLANPVYKAFLSALKLHPDEVQTLEMIPFLPIEMFKTHFVYGSDKDPEMVFESSGTTGQVPSRHHIAKSSLYIRSFTECFRRFYGDFREYCILALLPSYLDRDNSSLVFMMDQLIRHGNHSDSGFYLDELKSLAEVLRRRKSDGYPTLLLGVTFALLELAEKYPLLLTENIILMETGGMKGRREEMTRLELHTQLKEIFGKKQIHSEYGMTELLSQAYSSSEGLFFTPPWMKIYCRDTYDPKTLIPEGQTGGLNIIDLANIYSCSFIATQDIGKLHSSGGFEVLGRFDHSDIRGCNLMVE